MVHVARWVAAFGLLTCVTACTAEADGVDVPFVVVLRSVPDPPDDPFVDELRSQRLAPGRTVELEPRGPDVTYADADAVEAALAALPRDPDVVVAYSTPYAQLVIDRLPDVPVVAVVNDPVVAGLVDDRDRPEGRVTGVTFASPADRTLDLAARVVGRLDRLGYLIPADDPAVAGPRQRIIEAAAERGTELVEATFSDAEGVAAAVDELESADVDAILLGASNAVIAALDVLETELAPTGIPVIARNARVDFAVAVLEPDGGEVRRQVARQVARIIAGDDIATIPVEDPRRFRIVLDRGIADELELGALDADLLRQADEVR